MAVSFGMLGILLMLDICFIVNYFIVRALRYWTDKTKKNQKEEVLHGSEAVISDVAFAWLVGSVRLEAMSVRKFPNYRKIPYCLGLFSTSFFVILSCLLLAPELVAETLGISGITLDADFCVNERFDAGLADLKANLYNQTNFLEAHQQYHAITYLQDLILNDTALYGVPPFQCTSRPGRTFAGNKEEWNEAHDFSLPFFPNYCQEALESAIEAAQERECVAEICKCPTLPESPVFQAVGLANRELCAAEVCIPVPTACPPHEKDDFINTAWLEDYRYQQLLSAENRRNNLTLAERAERTKDTIPEDLQSTAAQTADKILHQVDIASYIYIAYSCIALFFPSPLILFRTPYLIGLKRFLFGVQKPYFIAMVVALWWGIEYFQAVWHSPDLWLFVHNVRVGDPCFMDPNYLMERQGVLSDLCEALMPLEQSFVSAAWTVMDVWREVSFFQESCQCPFPNQYTSQFDFGNMTELGFNNTLEVCNDGDCTTLYGMPNNNITYVGNASICHNGTAARRLIWESHADETKQQTPHMWSELWLTSGFLATVLIKVAVANFGISLMELADPFVVCAGEFLWMPTSFGRKRLNTRQSVGTRSSQQSTSTLETFDSEGRALPNGMVQAWFETKQRSLFHVSLSKAIFWGLLVHICMINLFLSVYQEIYSNGDFTEQDLPSLYLMLEQKDLKVLGWCGTVAAAVMALGVYIVCKLRQAAVERREGLPDTDDSSDDERNWQAPVVVDEETN